MHKLADLFLELYKAGNSLQEIADLYNISRERVRQILKTHPDYVARKKNETMILFCEKKGIPRKIHALPLTKCIVCNGTVSTTHEGIKREHCARCWKKYTPEGRAYNVECVKKYKKN